MADFSKQWAEIFDPEFPWDFDIEEVAKNLVSGYHTPCICEGFGFISIGKDTEGTIILYVPDWEDTGIEEVGHWIEYEKFINLQKKRML